MEQLEHKESQQPKEVVLEYRQPDYREVVEQYSYPLPVKETQWDGRLPAWPEPPKRAKKKGLRIFLICLTAVILLAAAGWLVESDLLFQPQKDDAVTQEEKKPSHKAEDAGEITMPRWKAEEGVALQVQTTEGDTLTPQEIYRQVNPAVVTVFVDWKEGMGVGTGVIFREDGYVLTNQHVVAEGTSCKVVLDSGHSYAASYVAGDAKQDLAILKIHKDGLPAAKFGDSDRLTVGDPVYAIGNPLGYELRGTLTDGIVSAINRDVDVDGTTMTLIQTNAALNAGNSGGPLINQYGQVVGINVIKMDSAYTTVEGLGFAIPTSVMKRLVNDLLVYGEVQPEPILGLMVMTVGTQLTDTLWGAEVDSVSKGSAAERAGVQKGDYIIAAGSIEEILNSNDVLRARREFHVGDQMPMTLWRDGEIVEVILDLQETAE